LFSSISYEFRGEGKKAELEDGSESLKKKKITIGVDDIKLNFDFN
jgi:hypothetical protein